MAKAMTAVSDVHHVTGGVALAEPPSSAPTVRIPALGDLAASHRHLPEVLADVEAPIEVGTALGLAVVHRIAVDNGPIAGMVGSNDGRRLVTTNYGDDSVSVIDTVSGAVVATLTGLFEPFAITTAAADSTCAYLSAASPAYDVIAALDLDTGNLVATYPQTRSVRDVAVSPDGTLIFASRTGVDGADVAVLDTTTEQVEVVDLVSAPGATAERVAISPDGKRLYVVTQRAEGSDLVVIDTAARRVVGTVDIGSPIRDIALNRDGGIVYVASSGPDLDMIHIVDTRAGVIAASFGLDTPGGGISQLTLSNDGVRTYLVTDTGVTVMSTLTHGIVGSVAVHAQPSCVVESADGSHLYIADYAGAVTVVSIPSNPSTPPGLVRDTGLLELEHVLV